MEVSEGTERANSIRENNADVKMEIREETKHRISENTEVKLDGQGRKTKDPIRENTVVKIYVGEEKRNRNNREDGNKNGRQSRRKQNRSCVR